MDPAWRNNSLLISARKERWSRFLQLDPSVRHIILVDVDGGLPDRPPCWPDRKADRIEWALRKYEAQLEQMRVLDDDKVPFLDVYTGTEIFPEAFGARVCRMEGEMPLALPVARNWQEAARITLPEFASTPLALLFEIADELRARAGPDTVLRLPDIQAPMDVVVQLWNKLDLFPAMLENPDPVMELASKVRTLMTSFLDEWFRRYGPEFVSHEPDYYMPCGITVSEDEIGCMNNRFFESFFLPELVGLSERYGQIGMHCCANARHHWKSFQKIPNLRLLHLDQSADVCQEAYREFSGWTAQWYTWAGDGPAWTWPKQLPADAHAVLRASAPDLSAAAELCHRIREQTQAWVPSA